MYLIIIKSKKYYFLLIILFLVGTVHTIYGKDYRNKAPVFYKTSALDPERTLSNINNWSYWMYADGQSGININGSGGGIYPRSTDHVIFQDGLIWGTKVNGENIRVGGQAYSAGTVSALNDRIYRIRYDWASLTMKSVLDDAGEFFEISPELVTQNMVEQIIEQYKKDWQEWPVQNGAPYVDKNDNQIYDPVLDINNMPDPALGDYPGIVNADQVVYLIADDSDNSVATALYGSASIGITMQVTAWSYDQHNRGLGQTIFKKYKIINTSSDTFEDMYLAQWCDPDVGDASDDLVGCDSILNSMFSYNGSPSDGNFNDFGIAPPAVAYTLMQGPIVPSEGDTAFFDGQKLADFANLSMTSFGYFSAGNIEWQDPVLQDYDGTLEWYNLLRGNIPTTDVDNPISFTNRNTGENTNFPLAGDPVTNTGDADGQGLNFPPGDRRMTMNSGPFNLNPGGSQEMIVAIIGGLGTDYLNSVTKMKENIEEVNDLFGYPIRVPKISYTTSHPNNTTTEIFFEADLSAFEGVTASTISDGISLTLYDDGTHNDVTASDNIWSNTLSGLNEKYPLSANFNIITTNENIEYENYLENIRFRPIPVLDNWQVVWENGLQDSKINNQETVHMQFDISNNDAINNTDTLVIAKQESFIYNLGLASGSTIASDPNYFVVQASSKDSITFFYKVEFDHHSVTTSATLPVQAWNPPSIWGNSIAVQSIVGIVDNVNPTVADPLLLTNHTYRINFIKGDGLNDILWQLKDMTTSDIKLDHQVLATSANHPHPIVDGILWKVTSPPFLVRDWNWQDGPVSPLYPGYTNGRWISAASNWGGGALFGGLGMAHIFWGEDLGVTGAEIHIVEIRFASMTSFTDENEDGFFSFDADGAEPYTWDTAKGQGAFMYETWGSGHFLGFNQVPFQVWDVNDPENPRQLNVIVRDRNTNGLWDPGTGNGPFNYVWIMDDDYDPTGTAWDGTTGRDFMAELLKGPVPALYTLWAGQRGTREWMAEDGILTIIPYLHNAVGDTLEIISTPVGISDQNIPNTYFLNQNYPNPFNPNTQINFGLAKKSEVKLEIFNILGQKVRTLISTSMNAGRYKYYWNGRNDFGNQTASGVYIYKLSTDGFTQSKKMVLIK